MGLNGIYTSAECTYKIKARDLTCIKKSINSIGIDGINSTVQVININSKNGIFSGQGWCANDSDDICLEKASIGSVLPGTYDMVYLPEKYGGSWWLDEGKLTRIFRKRNSFFLHLGSVSEGCITVPAADKVAVEKFVELRKMLNGMKVKMKVEK
ncbi:DUF2778 domain-containing protein [Acinetobacter shaoyimingii]|uniref:DUF2778 domain-containing protein n=1 Tax=Acinetobacter shaoyimingii TaxID=2715164 RepID=UPI001490165B|nr:DUF2778 domain-containing protein [Acinetobacter shaoyimingii]